MLILIIGSGEEGEEEEDANDGLDASPKALPPQNSPDLEYASTSALHGHPPSGAGYEYYESEPAI